MSSGSQTSPLVIFGFDAGEPEFLRRWAEDGTLPTLKSIMQRGCWGLTTGPEMISEHGMWVALTSGISRRDHGYYYHRQLVPGTYDLAPARGRNLGVEPFWRRLSKEKSIAIIDVPDIAAPQPQAGIQLSEWATHNPYFPPSSFPSDLLKKVHRIFGDQIRIEEELDSSYEDDRKIFSRLMERTRKKGELCLRLLEAERYDLVFVVFAESHTGGHQFWKYRSEARADKDAVPTGELADPIRKIYQAIDSEMGKILKGLPADSHVFVLSSVGMKSQWPAGGLGEEFCRRLGYQSAPQGSSGFRPQALLRRTLPQGIRDQLSRFLPRNTQDRLLSDKFHASTDWSRTRVFCIPSYYTSQFRVNLKGREPQGIVEPGDEYEQMLNELEADLKKLVDPATMKPAIKAIRRAQDLFGGGPPPVLPDLFAEWSDTDRFIECVVHPKAELCQTQCEFHRGSDHSQLGFVAAAGPVVEGRGNLGHLSPLDLVPTFLSHCGIEPPQELRGRLIVGMARRKKVGVTN